MSEAVARRIRRRKICVGDLNIRISINRRSFVAPITTVDFDQKFVEKKSVWAGLETVQGRNTFFVTNVNGDQEVTHVFFCRWFEGLNSEYWIEYEDENYDILNVENYEERKEFAVCYCNVRGNKNKAVNRA